MYISHETDAQKLARIEASLAQVKGLDFREHANYHKAIDIIYLTGRPHWTGYGWDHVMQKHFGRYDVTGDSDKPWAPLAKIAFGLTSPPLTNSQNNRVAYAADMLHTTLQFNQIAPDIIHQPTHLLNELGKRNGKGKPSIDRCIDSLEAYHKQKPVSTKRSNEMVRVPDPRKYLPPAMPPTGTADEARDAVVAYAGQYAQEDAEAGGDPIRGDYKPDPPDGYRWAPEYLDAWDEANYPGRYARIFYTARAKIDATKIGEKWAKEDFEDIEEGAPRRTIVFVGRPPHPVYLPIWTEVATKTYHARLDEMCRPEVGMWRDVVEGEVFPPGHKFQLNVATGAMQVWVPGPGPGLLPPGPGPGLLPPGPGPGPGLLPPGPGPGLLPPGPGPGLTPPGPGPGLLPPGPGQTEEQKLHQALCKAIAFKKCGKHSEKKMWAEDLVTLLEDGDYFTD